MHQLAGGGGAQPPDVAGREAAGRAVPGGDPAAVEHRDLADAAGGQRGADGGADPAGAAHLDPGPGPAVQHGGGLAGRGVHQGERGQVGAEQLAAGRRVQLQRAVHGLGVVQQFALRERVEHALAVLGAQAEPLPGADQGGPVPAAVDQFQEHGEPPVDALDQPGVPSDGAELQGLLLPPEPGQGGLEDGAHAGPPNVGLRCPGRSFRPQQRINW